MFKEPICVLSMRNELFSLFLIGCILSLMCRMGTGKVSFFSVLLVLSCGVNNFVQEELFILTTFT